MARGPGLSFPLKRRLAKEEREDTLGGKVIGAVTISFLLSLFHTLPSLFSSPCKSCLEAFRGEQTTTFANFGTG
jgi:hypothetical protein